MDSKELKNISLEELLKQLSASKDGLTGAEAALRLKRYGLNKVITKTINPISKFWNYLWNPLAWIIEIAALLSILINRWVDFWLILALLFLNAGIGFWQEAKALQIKELLKQKLALRIKVLRDNTWVELPPPQLVPGDIIRLRLGDIVPADLKLITGDTLVIDESALTGESLPSEKSTSDVAFAGSIVRRGEMTALVVATGRNTFFTKALKLGEETKTEFHFQKVLFKIRDYLIFLAYGLAILILLVVLLRHENIAEALQFVLVLAGASLPVVLPTILSVILTVGALALAKQEAIVNNLASLEALTALDILFVDKTGIITKNYLTVRELVPFGNADKDELLLEAGLASRAEDNNPIDNAILAQINSNPLILEKLKKHKLTDFHPFDPEIKRTEAYLSGADGKSFKVTKGAPRLIAIILAREEEDTPKITAQVNLFASQGLRTIAVAKTDENENWILTGLISLDDPPWEDTTAAIKTAQNLGVAVKMITGDYPAIAKEIAKKINLGSYIFEATALSNISDLEATTLIEKANGFAGVYPEDKFQIVRILQHKNRIVGITGDVVNDAPALKRANTGIAIPSATAATKSAAGIVLLRPGLSTILSIIKQSRIIFQRMNNYAIYRLAETFRILFFITISILIFRFYPVTALMLVLLALLNDVPLLTIAFDNVKYSTQPEKWHIRPILGMAIILGCLGLMASFFMLFIGQEVFHLQQAVLQSFIYLQLSVAGHFTVFATRTRESFWTIKPASALLFAVIASQLIATFITVYGILLPAIGWNLALFVWAYALITFIITDYVKIHVQALLDHTDLKYDQ